MENKAHALAAGTFVLLVAALLLAMAWWLTRDGSIRSEYEISSPEAVSGLNVQAGGRPKGGLGGKVQSIGFDPQIPGNVLMRIAIDTKAPITRSTVATLGYQGLTGIAHVQLDDDGTSREPLVAADGGVPRIPVRPGLIGRLTEQGGRTLGQLEEAARRFNQLLAADNQAALLGAVGRMGESAASVGKLSRDIGTLLDQQLGPVRTPIPQLVQDTRGAMQALQATASDTRLAVNDLRQTLKRLDDSGLVERLGHGADALAQGAATLNEQSLPRLNAVGDELARTSRQVGRAAQIVGDNPQSLLFGTGPTPPGPGEAGFVAPVPVAR